MKNIKKIGLGLTLSLAFVMAAFSLLPRNAAAASISNSSFANGQYNITSFENGKPKTIDLVLGAGGSSYKFTDRDTTDSTMNFKTPDNDGLICSQITNGWGNNLGITLTGSPQAVPGPGGGNSYSGYITLNYSGDTSTKCNDNNAQKFLPKTNISAISGVTGTPSAAAIIGGAGAACTSGADCQNGSCKTASGDCTNDPVTDGNGTDSCATNFGSSSVAWIICPILDAANGITTELVNTFEGQLSFTVGQLGTASDPTSGSYQLHRTWGIIRDISTTLIIIVMLVMVISQAASWGPLDAYTVRKMLPKLVIAVILMQISWAMFAYLVGLVDDVGRGLAAIMYYPFGGSSHMDLWHLLQKGNISATLLGSMNWSAVVVGLAVLSSQLFMLLGVAFVAITSLFFAVLTLVFRKILIIMCLIFAPFALLLWVIPGTQKYWKQYWDNFTKALLMFPIAVAIVAAGRIFAAVSATQVNGQFLNMLFILVGFFGPLFYLPKTFKWGGQIMSQAGNGMQKASKVVSSKPKKYFDKKQEEYNHQKPLSAAERLAHWRENVAELDKRRASISKWEAESRSANTPEERLAAANRASSERAELAKFIKEKRPGRQKFWSAVRGDKFRSGEWDPAYQYGRLPGVGKIIPGNEEMHREGEEKLAKFRAAVPNAEKEEYENDTKALAEELGNMEHEDDKKMRVFEIIDNPSQYRPSMVQAALTRSLQDRNFQKADEWSNRAVLEGRMAEVEKFKSYNAQTLGTLAPHLLKGELNTKTALTDKDGNISYRHEGIIRSAGGSESEVAQYHAREVEAILSHLTLRSGLGDKSATSALKKFLKTYASATQIDSVRGNMNSGGLGVMRNYVDNEFDPRKKEYQFGERVRAVGPKDEGGSGTKGVIKREGVSRPERTLEPNVDTTGREEVLYKHGEAEETLPTNRVKEDTEVRDAMSTIRNNIQELGVINQSPISAGAVGPMGPIELNIPHEQIANAVAAGAARGVEDAFKNIDLNIGGVTATPSAAAGSGSGGSEVRDTGNDQKAERTNEARLKAEKEAVQQQRETREQMHEDLSRNYDEGPPSGPKE